MQPLRDVAVLPGLARIILPGQPMAETVDFFIERCGFRVVWVYPADDPEVIELQGHGMVLRLEAQTQAGPAELWLPDGASDGDMLAPNGVRIRQGALVDAVPWLPVQAAFRSLRPTDDASWHVGRAGLRYQDLIPDRLGGGLIVSRIRLEQAGPLPDYVHYHQVAFQLIYCVQGDIQVVYEDQGEPFLMRSGDCVLQPPGIRHRVLSSTAGAEVIELACPARHETFGDPATTLPNGPARPGLSYGGQHFVRFQHQQVAPVALAEATGWSSRSFGLEFATSGFAAGRVVEAAAGAAALGLVEQGVLHVVWVLAGQVTLQGPAQSPQTYQPAQGFVLPAAAGPAMLHATEGTRLLHVHLCERLPHHPPFLEPRPR